MIRGIGEVTLKTILKAFPTPAAIWDISPDNLHSLFSSLRLKAPHEAVNQIATNRKRLIERARRELEKLSNDDISFLTIFDKEYPDRLKESKDPPKWLFVQGDVSCLSMPNLVAVVGTRNASAVGLDRARTLTKWLAEKNVGIVSGLAEGIDATAHQAALDFGVKTIGVLGTGILLYFPASTSALRRRIIYESGAVITEYFPNDNFSRSNFVRRNRIQAGLAYAIAPIEGHASSGTAHTYNFAKEYGRVTFGVTNGNARGEDGIIDLLKSDKRPVFNLQSDDDLTALESLLKPIVNMPKSESNQRSFAHILEQLRMFIHEHRISEKEFNELVLELRRGWRNNLGS
ncbi:MAG: DNA-processing protein DprA [Nitrospira sp.]|jgi:DNA protecting protein DprA|nr:DNA-processing protein DprA [Nitrospira sp.]